MPGVFSVPARRPAFLLAAAKQRRELDALLDVKRADALGAMQLVARQRQHVDRRVLERQRDFANGLNGVGVKQRADAFGLRRHFRDGKDHAGLVIGPLDG